jgi:predicted amidohydrolase
MLSIGFLQFDVRLGDISANCDAVDAGLRALHPSSPGLIVLPEMWATGFAYSRLPYLSEKTEEVLHIVSRFAREYNIIIAGSLPELSEEKNTTIYNTLYFTDGDGNLGTYRKQRLFAPMQEDQHLTPGESTMITHAPFGNIASLVCYDLRFPELVRRQTAQGACLLVVSAQWPLIRCNHWRTLLVARAIENQIFVAAANRCGEDSVAGGTVYAGHSMIIAPDGTILQEAGEEVASASYEVDLTLVEEIRAHFNTAV